MPASWTRRGSVLIRLARQHFAFYRGYLDGLDLRLLAERYPGGEASGIKDQANIASGKALLAWISQQLVIEAARHGQRSAARLLRIGPERLPTQVALTGLPTLDEFQEERDPYHMYSERELLDLFEQEYGVGKGRADRLAARNRRLRRRQEALLQFIEDHMRLEPRLDDPVAGWLDEGLARHLAKANIVSLRQLVGAIEAYGYHWHRKVPRIGAKAARHITGWLLLPATRDALGMSLSARGVTPPRKLDGTQLQAIEGVMDIVPLERLALPETLSGVTGTNRGGDPSIAASNDLDAIHAWLTQFDHGSHTQRAYRKEAERLLLWSVLELRKPLSSLDAHDGAAYLRFLADLDKSAPEVWKEAFHLPQARWLGSRGIDRWSPRWRPFEGGLSWSSQRTALAAIKSLTRFLQASGYLQVDPLLQLKIASAPHQSTPPMSPRRKGILADEWEAAMSYLNGRTPHPRIDRIKALLLLLKESNCRLQQIAMLTRDALAYDCPNPRMDGAGDRTARHGQDSSGWVLKMNARDGQRHAHSVPASVNLISALRGNYSNYGYTSLDQVPAQTPLLGVLSAGRQELEGTVIPLSGVRIYKILKAFFAEVADEIGHQDVSLAQRLRSISTESFAA